jgi:hypothetical protein
VTGIGAESAHTRALLASTVDREGGGHPPLPYGWGCGRLCAGGLTPDALAARSVAISGEGASNS